MAKHLKPQAPDASTLELQIHELVLHGCRPTDRYAVANAIERELSRLFSSGIPPGLAKSGSAADGFQVHRLVAGEFPLPQDASPDVIGVQIARAIHQGLGGAPALKGPAAPNSSPPSGAGGPGR